jgi:hypothetical protein
MWDILNRGHLERTGHDRNHNHKAHSSQMHLDAKLGNGFLANLKKRQKVMRYCQCNLIQWLIKDLIVRNCAQLPRWVAVTGSVSQLLVVSMETKSSRSNLHVPVQR